MHIRYAKGFAPIFIVLAILLAGTVGATAGTVYKDKIDKVLVGDTAKTADENADGTDDTTTTTKVKSGLAKFQLEGTITVINDNTSLTARVKTGTNTIRAMYNSEVEIKVSPTLSINLKGNTAPKLADIPVGAQVHIGGTIANNELTATKIIVQKEEAKVAAGQTKFILNGAVTEVTDKEIKVNVETTNKLIATMKSTVVSVILAGNTIIQKDDAQITISDIKIGDIVNVHGVYKNNILTASSVTVKLADAEVIQDKVASVKEMAKTSAIIKGNSANSKSKSKSE